MTPSSAGPGTTTWPMASGDRAAGIWTWDGLPDATQRGVPASASLLQQHPLFVPPGKGGGVTVFADLWTAQASVHRFTSGA